MTPQPERLQTSRSARVVVAVVVALLGFFAAQGAAADAQQVRAVTIEVDGRFTELQPVVVGAAARHRDGAAEERHAGPAASDVLAGGAVTVVEPPSPRVTSASPDVIREPLQVVVGAPGAERAPPVSLH